MFNSTFDRLVKKIDILKEENSKIKNELTDFRKSVQYHSDNVDEVNKKLEDVGRRIEEIKQDEITEDFFPKTKKKLVDLEDRSHRRNLCFDGIEEDPNEIWEESESIITDFVKEKLGIEENIAVERAHRKGKIHRNDGTRNKKRTVVVKILSFKNKSRILHTYREKKLWKEEIFLIKDFPEITASAIKSMLQKARYLKSQNKVVKVVHDRLIVHEKERENDISEAQGDP